jgi:poly-beta-1,6-N-acetyl-D-glucosamine biosynthesis protein PgaD
MNAPAWPPLIRAESIPAWIRVRDFVLTLGAWILLAWWTRGALLLIADWLSPPLFVLSSHAPPDWSRIWLTLAPFFAIAALLAAWLVFWSAKRSAILTRQRHDRAQPPALDLDAHATRFGITVADVNGLRGRSVVTVHFDAAGNIVPGALSNDPARRHS